MNTTRDTIHNESSHLRLDRNECICPSFIRTIISSVDINLLDYCTYKSAFKVINDIATHIQCHLLNLHVNNGSEVVIKTLLETLLCKEWVTTSPTFEMFNMLNIPIHGKTLDESLSVYFGKEILETKPETIE